MQSKIGQLGWILLISFSALAGCSVKLPQTSSPPPHAGSTVRVACPDEASGRLISLHSRGWQSRQQAKVEVVGPPAHLKPNQWPQADVWVVPAADLGALVAADLLEPLPGSVTAADASYGWMSLLPLYREKLLIWNRIPYALPLIGDAPMCCYRSDLLADTKQATAFEKQYERKLGPPVTWLEFEQIAGHFFQVQGRPSLPPLPADDAGLERLYYTIAAGFARRALTDEEAIPAEERERLFSFDYDLRTGQPRIAGPGFLHALQVMQRLQKYRAQAGSSPEDAFARGDAVLCLTDAWALARFQDSRTSKVRDKVGICRVPAAEGFFGSTGAMIAAGSRGNQGPYLGAGTWLAVVPKSAASSEAAVSLLTDLSGRETCAETVIDTSPASRWAGGALRLDQLEERTRWDAFDLDKDRTGDLKEALRKTLQYRGVKNPVLCPRTPLAAERRKVLVKELRAALQPSGDAAAALHRVEAAWVELDKKYGPEKALEDNRVSQGLLAR